MSKKVYPGADESTPSLAQYFSWINHTNEGPTEKQTLANLAFFQWMHAEYGMQLDIYAFDAGALDGCRFYGSPKSERFRRQFPNGLEPIVEAAAKFGCRLGIWGGPDGFGDTEEEARERIDTMVSLCRDHNFMLFKFDSVCGDLRPEKVKYFIEMMTECRKASPDLILLNHRLELGEGLPHATTFLWEGMEMYTDVHTGNPIPGTHNRVEEISRGLPPDLQRLTEDHGVCISSCVDHWEDSLIQQAFNRCLILAPEIYGSPWLMRDDEFPRLARIYNLHRRYRSILTQGELLPEQYYGKDAVTRGDKETRFLSLRNLSWDPLKIPVTLTEETGLSKGEKVEVRRVHPFEEVLGHFSWGETVEVTVEPFRACLVMLSTKEIEEIGFEGCSGEIVRDMDKGDAEVLLWGMPGSDTKVRVLAKGFERAEMEGEEASELLTDGLNLIFPGKALKEPWHRKLGELEECAPPEDSVALYEATCFSTDSNAFEVRELERSGKSQFPVVEEARQAFFEQEQFIKRGIWDKNLFDNNPDTFFSVCRRYGDVRIRRGAFRIDFGEAIQIDQLSLHTKDDYQLQPIRNHEAVVAHVSADLKTWIPVSGFAEGDIHFTIDVGEPIRYFRLAPTPDRVNEVRGYYRGRPLARNNWRASNLLGKAFEVSVAWSSKITVEEICDGSYLALPVFGPHVKEAVYASASCEGTYLGAARRAPSYPVNAFEGTARAGRSYTYFIPLDKNLEGKEIEVFLLGLDSCAKDEIKSEVWVTSYPSPHVSKRVILKRPLEG